LNANDPLTDPWPEEWIMKRVPLVSLALCAALVAVAQGQDLPLRGPVPFSTYDKDKDGSISPEEFYAVRGERQVQRAQEGRPMRGAATAPSFETLDSDRNGRLTEAELEAGQQAQTQQRPGAGAGIRQGRAGLNMPAFVDYDLNSDGELTEQEFNEARARRIQERAEQGGQMRNLPNAPAFSDIDGDRDGVVTAEEFTAHQVRQRGTKVR
jgi:Ca2+-binding EF-hand superfamily protein